MAAATVIQAVRDALSPPRIGTYERAVAVIGETGPAAIALYDWNAQVSAAFMAPLHICEVVVRNAVSDALTSVYGDRWPWSRGFERSLPTPHHAFNPQRDLENARRGQPTTGKVIPELKFVFWQKMFTGRHDVRVWDTHLHRVLPNLDPSKTVDDVRKEIYADREDVRRLRNRIAHHEPIFRRDLIGDFDKIAALIRFRCHHTAEWMIQKQRVTSLLVQP